MPSTALREVSLLQMLSESAFIVRYVRRRPRDARRAPRTAIVPNQRVFQTDRIDLARSAARARAGIKPTRSLTPRFLPCPSPHSRTRRLRPRAGFSRLSTWRRTAKPCCTWCSRYLDQDLKNYMDMTDAALQPAQGRGAGLHVSALPRVRTCTATA